MSGTVPSSSSLMAPGSGSFLFPDLATMPSPQQQPLVLGAPDNGRTRAQGQDVLQLVLVDWHDPSLSSLQNSYQLARSEALVNRLACETLGGHVSRLEAQLHALALHSAPAFQAHLASALQGWRLRSSALTAVVNERGGRVSPEDLSVAFLTLFPFASATEQATAAFAQSVRSALVGRRGPTASTAGRSRPPSSGARGSSAFPDRSGSSFGSRSRSQRTRRPDSRDHGAPRQPSSLCSGCGGRHARRYCPETVCRRCSEKGHFERDCSLSATK